MLTYFWLFSILKININGESDESRTFRKLYALLVTPITVIIDFSLWPINLMVFAGYLFDRVFNR